MRLIVNYFRSLFCKHNWKHLTQVDYYSEHCTNDRLPVRCKQIFICTKCLMKKEINY